MLLHTDHPLGSIKQFSYNELKTATGNFDASHRLGRGGFGIVYKVFLHLFILLNVDNFKRWKYIFNRDVWYVCYKGNS